MEETKTKTVHCYVDKKHLEIFSSFLINTVKPFYCLRHLFGESLRSVQPQMPISNTINCTGLRQNQHILHIHKIVINKKKHEIS